MSAASLGRQSLPLTDSHHLFPNSIAFSCAADVPAPTEPAKPTEHQRPSRLRGCARNVGTPEYMPPELVLRGAEAVSPAVDWWSLGCVLFQCLARGRRPCRSIAARKRTTTLRGRIAARRGHSELSVAGAGDFQPLRS